jgi:DNA-directed RNA polymerase specialized sigma24 family protein
LGFSVSFSEETTTFRRTDVADSPDLAGQLSIRQRMAYLLRKGALDPGRIAEELEADLETVKRTVRRYKKFFTVIEGGRVGLLDRGNL